MNNINEWIVAHWKQLIIAMAMLTLGTITLYYYIGIMNRADLVLNACDLCEARDYSCRKIIHIWDLNISYLP